MDAPTPSGPGQRNVFYGKLFIDQEEHWKLRPHHTNHAHRAVAYIVQGHRKEYPYTKAFEKTPLRNPFVHIKIILDDHHQKQILTIIPAQKLLNCSDGSCLRIASPECVLHVTCAKNENFIMDEKYFPTDIFENRNEKIKNSFETQFLSCMNQFYAEPTYCPFESSKRELISHQVLKEVVDSVETDGTLRNFFVTIFSRYMHGPKGCASEKDLIALATNIKTKHDNYSQFRYVSRRGYTTKPEPQHSRTIDFNFILATCLREIEYEYKAREKILNECIHELIARNLLAKICINQFMMRTFIQFIINQQLQKK